MSAPENRTMENPAQELQNQVRHRVLNRVLKRAQIAFKGHEAVIDCVVLNLADGGACLKVESSMEFRTHLILCLTMQPSAIAA
jgi:hypothetical protein